MVRKLVILAILVTLCLGAKVYFDTMRAPVVQTLSINSSAMPAGAKPFRIAFLTDIHIAGPDMPPSRLEDIIDQVNALKPDLVAITGDLVSEKRTATKVYGAAEIVSPLGHLRATHGVVLVPGNHDHWFDWPGLAAEIAKHPNLVVLQNNAVQVGGMIVAGLDDDFTGRADMEATKASVAAMAGLEGPQIWLSHSPDVFPNIPVSADLVLAGHTHCGQIAYPWGGAPATMSDYGDLYACGVIEQHGKTLVTGAGLGTSLLPMRLFTQPEIWLIEIAPAGQSDNLSPSA